MIKPTQLSVQLDAQNGDGLRFLIVGAGVAGLTLAQLLRRAGHHPVVIERDGPDDAPGYMLGLLPFVDPVLRRLGVEQEYLDRSVGMHRYLLRGATGKRLREYSLDAAIAQYGHYRGMARRELIEVITTDDVPVTFECTVAQLDQDAHTVRVTFDESGAQRDFSFDAVIGADGLNSATRSFVNAPTPAAVVDTGWGGWVAWADSDGDQDLYEETWGDGFFVGIYPVRGRMGVFVGGPRTETAEGAPAMVSRIRSALTTSDARTERALAAVSEGYYWSFTDARSARWSTGRVVLVGDAAAGFLPTAGVGASMAVESAAALADRLADTTRDDIPEAIRDYERAERTRVETAQKASRQLARLMFRSGWLFTRVRDLAARAVSLDQAFSAILGLLASARRSS
jgi:salicylate hydroxylase